MATADMGLTEQFACIPPATVSAGCRRITLYRALELHCAQDSSA
ncbi:hypothetical protein SNOG_15023 [Parastagonospora nodorum SN15]|uniref:Uncharacterized protein n=1 Tax=Phaeosphaeria nodorum (strain SN15 / ATCC MYA-4574 / FGSC 10173) TaxID=321614 RepID=Q0TZK9_PHANO|nr:hypothetical protein SNOG_15023 [Parastagonospora nodorum SN15]EAT77566.1 hypothetical protein SNOG_15023 [Parastagonospora nodorum SN15]